jgi:hypothetical protein
LSKTSLEYKLRNPFKNKTSKCYYTYWGFVTIWIFNSLTKINLSRSL